MSHPTKTFSLKVSTARFSFLTSVSRLKGRHRERDKNMCNFAIRNEWTTFNLSFLVSYFLEIPATFWRFLSKIFYNLIRNKTKEASFVEVLLFASYKNDWKQLPAKIIENRQLSWFYLAKTCASWSTFSGWGVEIIKCSFVQQTRTKKVGFVRGSIRRT